MYKRTAAARGLCFGEHMGERNIYMHSQTPEGDPPSSVNASLAHTHKHTKTQHQSRRSL